MMQRFFAVGLILVISLAVVAQPVPSPAPAVVPVVLDQKIVNAAGWRAGEDVWVAVTYHLAPQDAPVFLETTEKVVWLGHRAVVFLGAFDPLPERIVSLDTAWIRLSQLDEALGEQPLAIRPRAQGLRLDQIPDHAGSILQKMLPGVNGAYLAQVANFLAGNLSTLDITGTSVTISGFGQVINDLGEWTGVPIPGVPVGTIVMWSGTLASIPTGWALCDGSNSTPDLRDRFVFGVSSGEDPGATGGSSTHSHGISFAGEHSHGTGLGNNHDFSAEGGNHRDASRNDHTHEVHNNGSHSHSANPGNNSPPFFRLAFIMKVP